MYILLYNLASDLKHKNSYKTHQIEMSHADTTLLGDRQYHIHDRRFVNFLFS